MVFPAPGTEKLAAACLEHKFFRFLNWSSVGVRVKPSSEILAKIGIYSYSIYLFHVFFTAGSRIILSKVGVSDINLLFICSLFLGVFGAILTELFFDKYKITRLSLLGKSR